MGASDAPVSSPNEVIRENPAGEGTGLSAVGNEGASQAEHATGQAAPEEPVGTFTPESGTWLNWLTRAIFGLKAPQWEMEHGQHEIVNREESVKLDYIVVTILGMALLAVLGVLAAKQAKVRPEGKPTSLAHIFEAMLDGWQNYIIGIMGEEMGRKYTPLTAAFFFTILLFNFMGLIPGLLAPTANPNVPFAMAIVAFFATHFIAIKETGVKSWFMHMVGEPLWLAPLNFPLHLIGEIVKPVSLAIRLLCNMFGKEMVIGQLALLAVAAMAYTKIPIPIHLPILLLGVFIAFLQALVFATLLAIYIAIFLTHHDEHGHEHTEHVDRPGQHEFVGHPGEVSVA
jgi:F-type H+-transporting ATPase subunit a